MFRHSDNRSPAVGRLPLTHRPSVAAQSNGHPPPPLSVMAPRTPPLCWTGQLLLLLIIATCAMSVHAAYQSPVGGTAGQTSRRQRRSGTNKRRCADHSASLLLPCVLRLLLLFRYLADCLRCALAVSGPIRRAPRDPGRDGGH